MSISPASRFRFWSLATGLYWCGMAVMMHAPLKPAEVTPGWLNVPYADKLVHAVIYALLAGLLSFTLHARRALRRDEPLRSAASVARIVFLVVAAYGAVDELTQPLTGRHCDVFDYACDLGGALIGVASASRVARP